MPALQIGPFFLGQPSAEQRAAVEANAARCVAWDAAGDEGTRPPPPPLPPPVAMGPWWVRPSHERSAAAPPMQPDLQLSACGRDAHGAAAARGGGGRGLDAGPQPRAGEACGWAKRGRAGLQWHEQIGMMVVWLANAASCCAPSHPPGRRPSMLQVGRGRAAYRKAQRLLQQWRHFDLGWASVNAPPVKQGAPVVVTARTLLCWSCNPLRVSYVEEGGLRPHQLQPWVGAGSDGGSNSGKTAGSSRQQSTAGRNSRSSKSGSSSSTCSSGGSAANPLAGLWGALARGADTRAAQPQQMTAAARPPRGRRYAFAHTTLAGHQISGEERFAVAWNQEDDSGGWLACPVSLQGAVRARRSQQLERPKGCPLPAAPPLYLHLPPPGTPPLNPVPCSLPTLSMLPPPAGSVVRNLHAVPPRLLGHGGRPPAAARLPAQVCGRQHGGHAARDAQALRGSCCGAGREWARLQRRGCTALAMPSMLAVKSALPPYSRPCDD